LQTRRVYVRQNPQDGHLSVDEYQEMIAPGIEAMSLTNRTLHFGGCLHGTHQFWLKQKSQLVAMVDALGLPTVFFFTLVAADLQWPELTNLLGVKDPDNNTTRSNAVIDGPCLANLFFITV